MESTVFSDKNCSQRINGTVDPFKNTFSQLKSKCQADDKLYYKESPQDTRCHELTISGLGFHLGHEDKFHECSSENTLIAACIGGELWVEMRDTFSGGDASTNVPTTDSSTADAVGG